VSGEDRRKDRCWRQIGVYTNISFPRFAPLSALREIITTSFKSSLAVGLFVGSILSLFGPRILSLMGISPSTKISKIALQYLRTRSLAAPAVVSISVLEGVYRGISDTRTPTIASLISAATNLVLDPVLMFWFGWGARGAAAATVTANYTGLGFMIRRLGKMDVINGRDFVRRKKAVLATPTTSSSSATSILSTIITSNLSMLLKQTSLLLAWAYSTRRATLLGPVTAAAHQIGLTSWLLFALVSEGPSIAVQVIAAKDNKDYTLTKEAAGFTLKLAAFVGGICSFSLWILRPVILSVFTNDWKVKAALGKILPSIVRMQPLITATLLMEGMAIGGGKYKTLAVGNVGATIWSMGIIRRAATLGEVWEVSKARTEAR